MTAMIGFIGAGRMAEAMIRSLIDKNVYSRDEIVACAPSAATRERVSSALKIKMYENAGEVAEICDTLVLAIKPKNIPDLFLKENLQLGKRHLLISIAAGVKIETLRGYAPESRIIRVMPNHCCLVSEGGAGYAGEPDTAAEDLEKVKTILSAAGLAVEVREEDLDAVTGICGSSPAFLYLIADALADAGVKYGLSKEASIQLAAQSLIGAGKMLLESGKDPSELIDNVCSPGGTTVEGMKILEKNSVRKIMEETVDATVKRSREMGKN